jgi:TfuA protein
MPRHHQRSAPYRSAADVCRHFAELQDSQARALSLMCPIDDEELLIEIFKQGRRSDITIRALHAEGAELFYNNSLQTALEQLYRPQDTLFLRWMPLENIIFDVQLSSRDKCDELYANVRDHARAIRQLMDGYYVTFKARLTFSYVNGDILGKLLEHLVANGFGEITLEFALLDPSQTDVDSIKQELATFCSYSVARHPAVRITQLPFCFLPVRHFRSLYRSLRDDIPSQAHLFRQRALIRDMKKAEHSYHEPCCGCRRRAACYAVTSIGEHPEYQRHLVPSIETTVVFVGGSLRAADVNRFDAEDLVFTGPAEQGDALMAILEGFCTILLLDGYFFQRYALTTFELLVALLENINVFGASSLGALRGLELANYGMRVEGYVFSFLRSQKIAAYHVVAQTYDEHDQPLTEPLIAIHRFLQLAAEESVISASDRDSCYVIAEDLHFSQLSYQQLFISWENSRSVSSSAAERLREFHKERGGEIFEVKRQDAIALLGSFRKRIEQDGPEYSIKTVERARDKYLARLRSKYADDYDSSLATGWKESLTRRTKTGRERSLSETIELADKFFEDLDVVVADTSLLDKTHYFMVNVVFVPFFFLEYGNSAGSGYGETMEQALVSAYGEVLERIPCGTLRTKFADCDAVQSPKYPFQKLPFYESMTAKMARFFIDDGGRLRDRDYIECLDLVTGQKFALPKHGARLPNSCGMAAGNTLLEATLYGLYEVIEHDIYARYETNALMEELRHVNIDPDIIQNKALQLLVSDMTARGHQVHFFNLLNRYEIPMVLSVFYEGDRQLVFSGQCCRLDMQNAIAHSFHEALNGHYVSYFGSRDDRRGFEQKSVSTPLRFLDQFVGQPKRFADEARQVHPLSQQLDEVLERLQRHGIEHAFAIDLSPRDEYRLSVVKVVVPKMDYRSAQWRSPDYYRKCVATHQLVREFAAGERPVEEITWQSSALKREFHRPLQRFFKA